MSQVDLVVKAEGGSYQGPGWPNPNYKNVLWYGIYLTRYHNVSLITLSRFTLYSIFLLPPMQGIQTTYDAKHFCLQPSFPPVSKEEVVPILGFGFVNFIPVSTAGVWQEERYSKSCLDSLTLSSVTRR